jgi:hypothetical protein
MARLLLLGLLLLTAPVLRADSLASACLARALLGPGVWSRVLHIENQRTNPRHPAQFHALVFAIEDRLWLYDPLEGTRSLSRYAGRLEQDKADLTPLLRAVLPGFVRVDDVTGKLPAPDSTPVAPARAGSLSFGCFVKCILRWRTLQDGPTPPDAAGVLAFYFDTGVGQRGHSVLVYGENGHRYVYDPEDGETARLSSTGPDPTPLQMAREICTLQRPFDARLLALHGPAPATTGRIASTTEARPPDSAGL